MAEAAAGVRAVLNQTGPAVASNENRRTAKRVEFKLKAKAFITARPEPAEIQIQLQDLSVSGVGFTSRRLFHTGERLAIRIAVKGIPVKYVVAQVAHSHYEEGGNYRTGAAFVHWVPEEGPTLPRQCREMLLGTQGPAPAPSAS